MKEFILYSVLIILPVACNQKRGNHSMQEHEEMQMEDMPGMKHNQENSDTSLAEVLAPANKTVLSNAETIHPALKEITQTISASGYIAFDAGRNNKVSMRTSGRIEKLYVKLNYQYVRKGDKLMELYSPELNTIAEEYLHHLKTKSDSNLTDATKQKMKLLGLSENQIRKIETSKLPLSTITIYSSYDGFIFYDFQQPQNSSPLNSSASLSGMRGMGGGMGLDQSVSTPMQSTGRIREGDYVGKGQTLFVLNDCKQVYGLVSFDAADAGEIKPGYPIHVTSPLLPDEIIHANIYFVEPAFKDGKKFIQARVYLKNESLLLKVNSIVNAEIKATGKYLVVPTSSILSLGTRKFVWVKKAIAKNGNKILEATEIIAGKEFENMTQIVSGITEQDEIANDAGYLLDSESLIKPGAK